MSAIGPKQTCRKTQSMSLLGVKRTCPCALHVSAYDPKRTLRAAQRPVPELTSGRMCARLSLYYAPVLSLGGGNEPARVHHPSRRHGCRVADLCVRSTSEVADNRISRHGRSVGMDPLDRRLCPAAS